MGGTGNSDTYPYGIQYAGGKDQVYNRATGEVVEEFEPFGTKATQKLNQLVTEYQNASASGKAAVLAPKVAPHKTVAA